MELTPENVQNFTLLNPRCGTTLLLIVMLLATLLFIVIGKMPFALTLVSRIVLVPVVATVAYEFIRLMANLYGNPVVRAILAPGLALQKMTTRPPDLSMLEVGIVALKAVLVADGVVQEESHTAPQMAQTSQATQTTQAAYAETAEARWSSMNGAATEEYLVRSGSRHTVVLLADRMGCGAGDCFTEGSEGLFLLRLAALLASGWGGRVLMLKVLTVPEGESITPIRRERSRYGSRWRTKRW